MDIITQIILHKEIEKMCIPLEEVVIIINKMKKTMVGQEYSSERAIMEVIRKLVMKD